MERECVLKIEKEEEFSHFSFSLSSSAFFLFSFFLREGEGSRFVSFCFLSPSCNR